MSQRLMRIGSIYGSRWYDRQMFAKYGLPKSERIHGSRWPIVSGDTVQVIEGPEKGKVGQVLAVKRKTNQIVIKDVNVNIRTQKRSAYRAGYFYRTESPIHYTNVQLIDPIHQKPCKIRFGKDQSGENVRYSAMSGAVLPKPKREFTRPANLEKRMNNVMDTKPEDVWNVTFQPFVRNWRPTWNMSADQGRRAKASAYKGKETTYKRFQNSMVHSPIAHI